MPAPTPPPTPEPEQEPAAPAGKSLAGKIVGSSIALSLIILMCKFGGFIEKFFLGTVFGTEGWGGHSAAIYVALAVFVTMFYDILRYSVIPALLPALQVQDETIGRAGAWRLASAAFNLFAPVVVLFVVAMILWPQPLARLVNQQVVRIKATDVAGARHEARKLSPNYRDLIDRLLGVDAAGQPTALSAEWRRQAAEELARLGDGRALPALDYASAHDADGSVRQAAGQAAVAFRARSLRLATRLVQIMFIGSLFLLAGAITYSILNSQKRFVAPALGDFAFKMTTVLPLLAMAILLAVRAALRTAIIDNAMIVQGVAVLCGSLGLMLIQLWPLRTQLKFYHFRMEFSPALRKVVAVAWLPFVYAVFFWGFRRVTDIYFAFQVASNAYLGLEFAYRLMEAPFRFAIEPLAYVVFPYLAAMHLAKDHAGYIRTLMSSLRGLLLLLLPVALGLFVLRQEVIRLLFGYGQFNEESVRLVMEPLGWYALGMIALGLDLVLTRAYFGREDVKTPTVLEVLAWGVQIALILALWKTELGHAAIALAFTASRSLKAIALFVGLKWRVGQLDMRNNAMYLLRVAPAAAAMVVVGVLARNFLGAQFGFVAKKGVIAILGGAGAAAGLTYLAGLILFRVPELKQLIEMVKSRKKAKAAE